MKYRCFPLIILMALGLHLHAQSDKPQSLSDLNLKGAVKTVKTLYEGDGYPYVKTEQFNRSGFLEIVSYDGALRSGKTKYTYDKQGRLVKKDYFDFNHTLTEYIYDKKGCLVRKNIVTYEEEGDTVHEAVEYINGNDCKPRFIKDNDGTTDSLVYDKNGRLISLWNQSYRTDYTYDDAGRLLSEDNNRGETVTYFVYDGNGSLVETWTTRDGKEIERSRFEVSGKLDAKGNWLTQKLTYSDENGTRTETITRTIEYYSK